MGMAPGPFIVFTLVPLLRAALHPRPGGGAPPSAAALLARFNAAAANLLRAFGRDRDAFGAGTSGGGSERAFRVRVLVSLSSAAGCVLTGEQASRLLAHCESCRDMSMEPDWVAWGALPEPPRLSCDVVCDRFVLSGRGRAGGTTFRSRLTVTGEGRFTLRSYAARRARMPMCICVSECAARLAIRVARMPRFARDAAAGTRGSSGLERSWPHRGSTL